MKCAHVKNLLAILIMVALLHPISGQDKKTDSNWPSFRGVKAAGIAENYSLPASWNVENSKNIKWKTPLPGLGHSSPVIWGDRIFITTALSGLENPELKVGLYGDINPVADETEHEWKVICLNKATGLIEWEQTAHRGIPEVKRHPKATHANSTPATDGRFVIAFFGSEGLYCYDMRGKLQWKKDFGVLDSAFFAVPTAQWGFASSPIIHDSRVIIQCDVMQDSFLAAFDITSGREIWRVVRNDYPTWSTPTVHVGATRTQVIVNGYKHIGGYDFKTGKELWKISGGGDIPVPTPVVSSGLVFINSAHGKMSPIYAIKLDAVGDISLKPGESANANIKWSIRRGGAYMQTPLIYRDYLYNLQGNGSLSCYRARTGERIYREKLGNMAAFSASGVAADGKLYFASEEGDIFVVAAGPDFKILAQNSMQDICMASPAISAGTLFIRSHHYLYAIAGQ